MNRESYVRPKPRPVARQFGDWFRVIHRGVGGWAFVLHRFTGSVLVGYLLLHFYFLSYLARGPEAYQAMVAAMESPWLMALEVLLIGAVVYHALNGLRLVLMAFNIGVDRHEAMFWASVVLSALLTAVAAVWMF